MDKMEEVGSTRWLHAEPSEGAAWDVRQVSLRAGVTEQAVRKALTEGRLVGVKGADSSWSIPPKEAEAWVRAVQSRRSRRQNRPASIDGFPSRDGVPNLVTDGGAREVVAGEGEGHGAQALIRSLRAERDTYRFLLQSLIDETARQARASRREDPAEPLVKNLASGSVRL